MELTELKKMRAKQIVVTNGLILTLLAIYFIMISVLVIFTRIYLFIGIFLLIQAILGFLKGDSIKSFIPIFEQVANYEKQKMGSEWYKQRKMGYVWNLILSSLMFLQSYWYRDSTDNVLEIDVSFMLIMVFLIIGLINISLIIHIRKVDRSTSPLDMKGYTWKSTLIGIVVGVMFVWVMFVIILFYVI